MAYNTTACYPLHAATRLRSVFIWVPRFVYTCRGAGTRQAIVLLVAGLRSPQVASSTERVYRPLIDLWTRSIFFWPIHLGLNSLPKVIWPRPRNLAYQKLRGTQRLALLMLVERHWPEASLVLADWGQSTEVLLRRKLTLLARIYPITRPQATVCSIDRASIGQLSANFAKGRRYSARPLSVSLWFVARINPRCDHLTCTGASSSYSG